jgi:hypothetical protein
LEIATLLNTTLAPCLDKTATPKTKDMSDEDRAFAIVEKFIVWRKTNDLSQRQAAAVLNARGFPITISVVQAWEHSLMYKGQRRDSKPKDGKLKNPPRPPGFFVAKALDQFLKENPTITDAPVFSRKPLSEKDIDLIRNLREKGYSYDEIGHKLGRTGSGVWRILNGQRRSKGK